MYAIYNPTNLAKLETAMNEELARLLADGVTEEELERGKRGFLQEQEIARASDTRLTDMLGDNLYANRTMKYYSDLESRIESANTPNGSGGGQEILRSQTARDRHCGRFQGREKVGRKIMAPRSSASRRGYPSRRRSRNESTRREIFSPA